MNQDCPLRILIVDHEDIVRKTLGQFLRKSGYFAEEVGGGTAALEAIENRPYDLAFIDVRMPGIDGLTLLARSRNLRPEMPVVMMAGHGDPVIWDEALKLGAVDLLVKPIKMLELDIVLAKLCQNSMAPVGR